MSLINRSQNQFAHLTGLINEFEVQYWDSSVFSSFRGARWFEEPTGKGSRSQDVITRRPIKPYLGELSKWNAVGNPIVYHMNRVDFSYTQINSNGGLVQLQFNAVNLSPQFTVGDIVKVVSENGVYNFAAAVTISTTSGANTLITLDYDYISGSISGYCNNNTLKKSYAIEVQLYSTTDNTLLTDTVFKFAPNSLGYTIVDVSKIIRSLLSAANDMDLSLQTFTPTPLIAFDDANVYKDFYIKYTEVWSGSDEDQVSDADNNVIGVLGSRQIRSTYGGNMGEYVGWEDGGPQGVALTKLDRPVMWRGYPFSLSFIVDNLTYSGYSSLDVFINGVLNKSIYGLPANQIFQLPLTDITEEEDDSFTVSLVKQGGTAGQELWTELTIEVRDACANPVLLVGRNSLGGVLQWLFDTNQEYTFDYGNGIKAKRLTLTAVNLTLNQWESLQDFITLGSVYSDNIVELESTTIKTSTRVGQQVYAVDSSGNKTGVIVLPTKNKTRTKQIKHTFEIEIEYPDIF